MRKAKGHEPHVRQNVPSSRDSILSKSYLPEPFYPDQLRHSKSIETCFSAIASAATYGDRMICFHFHCCVEPTVPFVVDYLQWIELKIYSREKRSATTRARGKHSWNESERNERLCDTQWTEMDRHRYSNEDGWISCEESLSNISN